MREEKRRISEILILLWIGLVVCLSLAMRWTVITEVPEREQREFQATSRFYQVGNNWEVKPSILAEAREVQEDGAVVWKLKNPYYKKSNAYIMMEVSGDKGETIKGTLTYLNGKGRVIQQQEVDFSTDGICIISLRSGRNVEILLQQPEGKTIELKSLKFLEQLPVGSAKMLATRTAALMIIYIILIAIGKNLKKRFIGNLGFDLLYQEMLFCLQLLFIQVGELGKWWHRRLEKNTRRVLRGGLFMALLLFSSCQQGNGNYGKQESYRYVMLVCCLIMTAIAILSWERTLQYIKWHGIMANSYFAFLFCCIVTGIFVRRRYTAVQYILLFVVTFFVFMWQNMEKPQELMQDLLWGTLAAIVLASFIWVCNPNIIPIESMQQIGLWRFDNLEDQMVLWKQYIYSMNLWGNGYLLKYWGTRQMAYNGVFEILYRYGIVGMIPYVIMLGVFASKLVQTILRKDVTLPKRMRVYILPIGIISLILLMTTNLEFPFISVFWPMFYLAIGWFFEGEKESFANLTMYTKINRE